MSDKTGTRRQPDLVYRDDAFEVQFREIARIATWPDTSILPDSALSLHFQWHGECTITNLATHESFDRHFLTKEVPAEFLDDDSTLQSALSIGIERDRVKRFHIKFDPGEEEKFRRSMCGLIASNIMPYVWKSDGPWVVGCWPIAAMFQFLNLHATACPFGPPRPIPGA